MTTTNLTISHGPVINIVSEATQHQSSPVDQHQRSQVDQHQRSQVGQHQRSQVVPNQRQTGNIQRLPSTLMQRVQMPVNESTNNDLSVGAPAATSNNIGMLTQTGEIAIEQSNVNLNSQFLGPQPPDMMTSIFDPISFNIPLKLKEKIWNGEFVELNLMLKSNQTLLNKLSTVGNLAVKEGILSVVRKKSSPIKNRHVWTSAFMVYVSVMLEKWPIKGLEFLKYMHTVRTVASRGCPGGWVLHNEQYRLRKARFPASSWGVVDGELWMFCVTTPNNGIQVNNPVNSSPLLVRNNLSYSSNSQNHGNINMTSTQKQRIACKLYNRGLVCTFGKNCKFLHKCQKCNGNHPASMCEV